jgi:hypothetical protein
VQDFSIKEPLVVSIREPSAVSIRVIVSIEGRRVIVSIMVRQATRHPDMMVTGQSAANLQWVVSLHKWLMGHLDHTKQIKKHNLEMRTLESVHPHSFFLVNENAL